MGGRLQNKIALITGSTTGIGKACANRFVEEGARVIINDHGEDREMASATLEEIKAKGGDVHYFSADVRSRKDIENLVDFTIEKFGSIDILINNAVAFRGENSADEDENIWENLYLSSVTAILRTGRCAVPKMIEAGGGTIINLSSIHGLLAGIENIAYATFKGAVLNMTRFMAVEYGPHNIRVNALCPGRIVTERKIGFLESNPVEYRRQKANYPLGRPGTLLEIANAALFLASEESSFITGQALVVDGGLTAQLQDAVAVPLEKGISEELLEKGFKWP